MVQRPPQARICFSSAVERKILPMAGKALNSFMSRILPKTTSENVGPGTYEVSYFEKHHHPVLKRHVNKNGYGGLAMKLPRFKSIDQNETHKTEQKTYQVKKEKPTFKPFGSSLNRPDFTPNTPGVGTYSFKNRKYIYRHSFGGKIKTIPGTITLCTPQNLDVCSRCNEQPYVDYWKHFEDGKNLCRACMQAEINRAKYRSKTKLLKFKTLDYLNQYKVSFFTTYCKERDELGRSMVIQFIFKIF